MVRFETTVTIHRPVQEVFAFLRDPDALPQWQAGVVEVETEQEGPMQAGSKITEIRKFLGKQLRSTLQITALDENRTLNLKVLEGPIPFSVNQDFEDLGDSTKITVVGEGEPGGLFKLAEPIVGKAAERQLKADFETLKDLLEARQ
jgi:uncharacterized membrane protein